MKKYVIGLTGPIASGKDTAAAVFRRHGALVIDADMIGHEIVAGQSQVWHEIVKAFGAKVLNRGGRVNRKKLARIVFSNVASLKKLDKIMHPEMRREIIRRVGRAGNKLIIINAALLAEMKLLPIVDKVIVVLAAKTKRIRRLLSDGSKRAEALARIRSQAGASRYRSIADIVIENNKSIADLRGAVKRVISRL